MNICRTPYLLFTLLVGAAMLPVPTGPGQTVNAASQAAGWSIPPRTSSKSLAKPLDAAQFSQTPTDYVAYTLAGLIPEVLAKQPCFCPCHFIHHHQSLLDCFAGQHGRECGICKQEVIFCYEQHRQGKSKHQIRNGLKSGAWTRIDVDSFTKAFLSSRDGHDPR